MRLSLSPSREVTVRLTDYVPTQVIAELFRVQGFDGLAYRSSLGDGHNVGLFDLGAADPVNCFLHRTIEIKFTFEQAT